METHMQDMNRPNSFWTVSYLNQGYTVKVGISLSASYYTNRKSVQRKCIVGLLWFRIVCTLNISCGISKFSIFPCIYSRSNKHTNIIHGINTVSGTTTAYKWNSGKKFKFVNGEVFMCPIIFFCENADHSHTFWINHEL